MRITFSNVRSRSPRNVAAAAEPHTVAARWKPH